MKRSLVICMMLSVAACGGTTVELPTSASSNLGTIADPTTSANTNVITTSAGSSTTPSNPDPVAPDASFASLLNSMRLQNGAGDVTHNGLLDQAAQDYAELLLATNHFSHTGPDGSHLRDRVNATGYDWQKIGENLGSGQQTEQQIMDGWTGSPGHHANNIDPDFTEFGLGFDRDGFDTRWVLVLGRPR